MNFEINDNDQTEIYINDFVYRENKPLVPVFKPTMEEFKYGLSYYIQNYVETTDAIKIGLCKIIPPKEWQWNSHLQGIEEKTLAGDFSVKPIKQFVSGSRGIYRLDFEDEKKIPLQDFKEKVSKSTLQVRSDYPVNINDLPLSEIEPKFWKTLTGNSEPTIYGSDNVGTLFNADLLDGWNFNKLDTMMTYGFDYSISKKLEIDQKLETNDSKVTDKTNMQSKNHSPTVNIPGITTPMLYFGAWKTLFGWHSEDLDLYSGNFLHFGAPKIWYGIPRTQNQRFESLTRSVFPGEFNECTEFLRHKTVLVSPKQLQHGGVSVVRCVQRPGDFMITFPRAYHAGFNCGFNCAEAVNFATPYWISYGRNANWCKCEAFTVKFSIDAFIQNVRTHKPELLAAFPIPGDQILINWEQCTGNYLVRVKKEIKTSSNESRRYEVALSCKPSMHLERLKEKKLVLDLSTDIYTFPTNNNPAWPRQGDVIFVEIVGFEFMVRLYHRFELENEEILSDADLNTRAKQVTHQRKKVNYSLLMQKTHENLRNQRINVGFKEESPTKTCFGLTKTSKVKDLGIQDYSDIYIAACLEQEFFGYYLFNASETSWRWPTSSEDKYIAALPHLTKKKANPKLSSFKTDKKHIFGLSEEYYHGMSPDTSTSSTLAGISWEDLKRHHKSARMPVANGDIIIIKWDGYKDDYMVRVSMNQAGSFYVSSVFNDPEFGTWDFNPTVDDWKRPTIGDLKLLQTKLSRSTNFKRIKLEPAQQTSTNNASSGAWETPGINSPSHGLDHCFQQPTASNNPNQFQFTQNEVNPQYSQQYYQLQKYTKDKGRYEGPTKLPE